MNQPFALIIEDQRDNELLFKDVLEIANCHVDAVRDGLAAVEWLDSHEPPQLIILDLNLPYMDGIEVYRYIRHQPRYIETRIIATTANMPMVDILKAELNEKDSILPKPVNIADILNSAMALSV